jgi:hypothetical protein
VVKLVKFNKLLINLLSQLRLKYERIYAFRPVLLLINSLTHSHSAGLTHGKTHLARPFLKGTGAVIRLLGE